MDPPGTGILLLPVFRCEAESRVEAFVKVARQHVAARIFLAPAVTAPPTAVAPPLLMDVYGHTTTTMQDMSTSPPSSRLTDTTFIYTPDPSHRQLLV